MLQGPIRQEGLLDGRSFSTSGLGARSGDIATSRVHSYVLDEDRVRQIWFSRQLFYPASKTGQRGRVGVMLTRATSTSIEERSR
ncbi:MAG: hypothetical protein CM1200mP26_20980 [Acidimicrobiales bacterium]|nr:MAG: hypothetical protein CM1200mP26_20980 [Acidimicrobiales bacterium]